MKSGGVYSSLDCVLAFFRALAWQHAAKYWKKSAIKIKMK